jgi:hypothetical protein
VRRSLREHAGEAADRRSHLPCGHPPGARAPRRTRAWTAEHTLPGQFNRNRSLSWANYLRCRIAREAAANDVITGGHIWLPRVPPPSGMLGLVWRGTARRHLSSGLADRDDPQATATFRLGRSELAPGPRLVASEWPWRLARAGATGPAPTLPLPPEHA